MKKIKFIATVVLIYLLSLQSSFSQNDYPNWVIPNEDYLKIGVAETGIYEITYEELKNFGFTDSKNIKIFRRGIQIPIEVNNTKNTIKFYGQKNDGLFDKDLYGPSEDQMHPSLSMFTDTSYYFLTESAHITETNRILQSNQTSFSAEQTETHDANVFKYFGDDFSHNTSLGPWPTQRHAYFVKGQGFTSNIIRSNEKFEYDLPLENICKDCNQDLKITISLNGRGNNERLIYIDSGLTLDSISITNFDIKELELEYSANNVPEKLTFYSEEDRFSVNSIDLKFIERLTLNDKFKTYFPSSQNKTLKIETSIDSDNLSVYNYVNDSTINIPKYELNEQKELLVNSENALKTIVSTATLAPNTFEKVKFPTIELINKNYIIIAPKQLENSAIEYKEYRESTEGGSFNVGLYLMEDIENQYGYGERNQYAITKFFKNNFSDISAEYVLLIGKGFGIYLNKLEPTKGHNLIPTFGYPAADGLLLSGLSSNQSTQVENIPIGRLPAINNGQILIYLDKVKKHESSPTTIFDKRIVHLSGGKGEYEEKFIFNTLNDIKKNDSQSGFTPFYTTYVKKSGLYIDPTDISEEVNQGASLISFLGHGSFEFMQMEIGKVNDPTYGYQDIEKYPILFLNGCSLLNSFSIYPTLVDNWLFVPNRGAIAAVGQSNFAYLSPLNKFMDTFYQKMYQSGQNNNIGNILQETKYEIENNNPSILDRDNQQISIILGDPYIKIFNFEKVPDYGILEDNIIKNLSNLSTSTEKINFELPITNLGTSENGKKITVNISQISATETITEKLIINSEDILNIDTISVSLENLSLIKKLIIELVPEETSLEKNKINNVFEYDFEENQIDTQSPSLITKIDNKNPVYSQKVSRNSNIKITVLDNKKLLNESDSIKVKLSFKKITDSSNELKIADLEEVEYNEIQNTIVYEFNFNNLEIGEYDLYLESEDISTNKSETLIYRINIVENSENSCKVYPIPTESCVNFEIKISENELQNESIILKIIDFNGKVIYSKTTPINNNSFFNLNWCKPTSLLNSKTLMYKVYLSNNKIIKTGKILYLN